MSKRWQRFVRRFAETYFGRKTEQPSNEPIKVTPRINWTVTCPCKKGPLKGKITVGNKLETNCLNCGRLFTLTIKEKE